jgi:hypothetical protein
MGARKGQRKERRCQRLTEEALHHVRGALRGVVPIASKTRSSTLRVLANGEAEVPLSVKLLADVLRELSLNRKEDM